MSGRRHHIVPKFLQKGFCSKIKKKQCYTIVFTRERAPYETNLDNIGLELDFYGNPNELTADDSITNAENEYSVFINSLRDINSDISLNANDCAKFAAHMHIRTKNIRESIKEIGESLFTETKDRLLESGDNVKLIKNLIKYNRKEAAKQFQEALPQNWSKEQRFLITKRLLDKPDKWASLIDPKYHQQFILLLTMCINKLPDLVKQSHNTALEKVTEAKGVYERAKEFHWQLINYEKPTLILGDIGVFGRFNKSTNEYRSLLFLKEGFESTYIPISNNQLAVGCYNKNNYILPSPKELNRAIASVSQKWFISSFSNDSLLELSQFIGTNCSVIGDEERVELNRVLSEITP